MVVGRPTQLIYISDIYLLDDQHRNTNMKNKDHLVGQLTSLGAQLPQNLDITEILFQRTSFKILSCQEMGLKAGTCHH